MKFIKKPVVIDAVQFTGTLENLKIVESFCKGNFFIAFGFNEDMQPNARYTAPAIRTLEGNMKVSVGDWIIKGIKGEFYPCKPDIFEMTYDKLEEK